MGLCKPIAVLAYLWDIVHLHVAFFLPNLSLGWRRNAWGGVRRQRTVLRVELGQDTNLTNWIV